MIYPPVISAWRARGIEGFCLELMHSLDKANEFTQIFLGTFITVSMTQGLISGSRARLLSKGNELLGAGLGGLSGGEISFFHVAGWRGGHQNPCPAGDF